MNGTQLAAGYDDGTVITWSYPSGKILFQMNSHKKMVYRIKWNQFRQDVFATLHWVRNEMNYLFRRISSNVAVLLLATSATAALLQMFFMKSYKWNTILACMRNELIPIPIKFARFLYPQNEFKCFLFHRIQKKNKEIESISIKSGKFSLYNSILMRINVTHS